jgi:hypothetical protein
MNDQIPLYVGIPLALLCVSAAVGVIIFIIAAWRGKA